MKPEAVIASDWLSSIEPQSIQYRVQVSYKKNYKSYLAEPYGLIDPAKTLVERLRSQGAQARVIRETITREIVE